MVGEIEKTKKKENLQQSHTANCDVMSRAHSVTEQARKKPKVNSSLQRNINLIDFFFESLDVSSSFLSSLLMMFSINLRDKYFFSSLFSQLLSFVGYSESHCGRNAVIVVVVVVFLMFRWVFCHLFIFLVIFLILFYLCVFSTIWRILYLFFLSCSPFPLMAVAAA